MFEVEPAPARQERSPIPLSDIDFALSAQLVVAWAGELGEDKRLGWWKTDLISEYGGEDLFKRLLPKTWEWAVLQGAREAARRTDAELRSRESDADRIVSLYSLGFELDERIDERLQDLKRSGLKPEEALPALSEAMTRAWNKQQFQDWVQTCGEVKSEAAPAGRRLKGGPPAGLDQTVLQLVGALAPLGDSYPMPHFRKTA